MISQASFSFLKQCFKHPRKFLFKGEFMNAKKCALFFFLLGFLLFLPSSAFAVKVEFQFEENFHCDLRIDVADPQTNDVVLSEPLPSPPDGAIATTILQLAPGSYELSLIYDSATMNGAMVIATYMLEFQNDFDFVQFIVTPTGIEECTGPNPNPEPLSAQICVTMPDGYGPALMQVINLISGEFVFSGNLNNNDCVDITPYVVPDLPYNILASADGLPAKSIPFQLPGGGSGNFDVLIDLHLPPDVRLLLSNPDYQEVTSIDAQVGEQIVITAVDVNNPGFGLNLGQVFVNGHDNRSFQLHLQFFENGSGWGGNSVTFLTEPRDAGLTLELTAKVLVFTDDPASAEGGLQVVDAGPVYINVDELPTGSGGGGDIEIVRQELLDLITSIQNDFQIQLNNIRLEFSDGLDAIGNLPVSEGNKSSTLYKFLQDGGKKLQGHFDHKK